MAGEIPNGTATVRTGLTAPHEANSTVTTGPSNSAHRHAVKELKTGPSNKPVHTNVDNSTIYTSQRVETTQMFISLCTEKQNVV